MHLNTARPSPQNFTNRTPLPKQRDYLPPLITNLAVLKEYDVAVAVAVPILIAHES